MAATATPPTPAGQDVVDARFQLLGPVRAWAPGGAGAEIDLGAGKQRAVLAVLLLHAGRPVPTARIVAAVWGDEPPANGLNVVQKYVAGLRRALEPARSPRSPGQVIALTDGGYVLTVDPAAVDAARFAAIVGAGVAAQRAGRADEAASTLRKALDLWHGEPLAGLGGAWFAAERQRLVDGRGLACEAWAAAELELGHHDRLAPELRRLADEFPLRERLRELHMLALYRSGRRAEALAVFRDTRELLVDEVGAEPGAALQDLFGRMLRSDPALAAPAPPDSPAVPRPPEPGAPPEPTAGPREPGAPPPPQRRHPAWGHLGRGLATAGPLLTLGFLTWAFIGYHAITRRSRALAVAAAAYGVAAAGFIVIVGESDSADLPLWRDATALALWGFAIVVGTAHQAALVHGPRPADQPD
jgi:DNA-binding SARP family transcriptional activator